MENITATSPFDSENQNHVAIGILLNQLIAQHHGINPDTLSIEADDCLVSEMGGLETFQDIFNHLHEIAGNLTD